MDRFLLSFMILVLILVSIYLIAVVASLVWVVIAAILEYKKGR